MLIDSPHPQGEDDFTGIFPVSEYQAGDYIKVEFPDDVTRVGERMWVRVQSCDAARSSGVRIIMVYVSC